MRGNYSVLTRLLSQDARTNCTTPILSNRAGNGTRTRDPNLGKVVLYQLSYSRTSTRRRSHLPTSYHPTYRSATTVTYFRQPSGGEGNRTPDLLNAIQALSQLSYAPGTHGKTNVY